MYHIDSGPIHYDQKLISELTMQCKRIAPNLNVDDLLADRGLDTTLEDIEALLVYRLAKTAVLYGDSEFASRVLTRSAAKYPDDPRLILYSAIHEMKTGSS